jgi:hypothetical protein
MMPRLPGALFTSVVISVITAASGIEIIPVPSWLEGTGKAPIIDGTFRTGLAGGKFAATLPGIPTTGKCVLSARADTEFVMGFLLLDIRYEHVETDVAELVSFRSFLDVRQPVAERFCLFGGIGYGYQSSVIEINGEPLCFGGREILFNCGIQAEWDPVIVTASYIHCLDRSTKAEYRSDVQKLHESDIGSLEARFEYRFSPTWGSSLSVETQLNRDTVIEKQFLIALGLTRRF